MRKFSGLLIVLILLLSSCIKQGDVSVKKVENISVRSMSNIDMRLSVENLSGQKVRVESAKFYINRNDKLFATIILRDRIMIPKRSTSSVDMNWAIKLDNPLSAFVVFGSLQKSLRDMRVSGEIVAKAGWIKKKIKLDNVPMSQISANFGADIDELVKSLEL